MNPEKREGRNEAMQEIGLHPPAVESFLDHERAARVWPEDVVTDRDFIEQAEKRRQLNDHLDQVANNLPRPDVSLETAIQSGFVTEQQAIDLYSSLGDLLEDGSEYDRAVLYLPFEFLPSSSWEPKSETLQAAADRFRNSYMNAWNNLLTVHDVRANFVDGDVLEIEQRKGDLPRVVKAAHLIPKLVEHGFLQTEEVLEYMEQVEDPVLRASIADTIPVLSDLELLTPDQLEMITRSKDPFMQDIAARITNGTELQGEEPNLSSQNIDLVSVQERLQHEFAQIDSVSHDDITKKRAEWLTNRSKQEAIEQTGEAIQHAIAANQISAEVAQSFLDPSADSASQQAFIIGVRKAIEAVAPIDSMQAQKIYSQHQNQLEALWPQAGSATRDTLTKTFYRLHQSGIIDASQLATLNLPLPNLTGPIADNLRTMMPELHDIRTILASIETHHELSQFIYPIALIYGSRVKGYDTSKSDIDIAVLIKPNTSLDKRANIQSLLKKAFAHEKIGQEILEFWLAEADNTLTIRNFKQPDVLLGDSSLTHILFGAAWEGNKREMRTVRQKLLTPYLYDTSQTIHGRSARGLYLEEMERDALQYRLMHKGYEQYFPSYGGIHTRHADAIDGKSMFWDSGYRQTATKLFASRVFLPRISQKRK